MSPGGFVLGILFLSAFTAAELRVLVKDYATREFYLLSDAPGGDSLTVACDACVNSAAIAASSPDLVDEGDGLIFSFVIDDLDLVEDAGKVISVTLNDAAPAEMDTAQVIYYGIRRQISLEGRSLPAGGVWQTPLGPAEESQPDLRHVESMVAFLDDERILRAFVVVYGDWNDEDYEEQVAFGDFASFGDLSQGEEISFPNQQIRKVSFHYVDSDLVGIQVFKASPAHVATIYGQPGDDIVTVEVEDDANLETFVGWFVDADNWSLFPVQYTAYAPVVADWEAFSSDSYTLHVKTINHLENVYVVWSEGSVGPFTLGRSAVESPGIQDMSIQVRVRNPQLSPLLITPAMSGQSRNFRYGRRANDWWLPNIPQDINFETAASQIDHIPASFAGFDISSISTDALQAGVDIEPGTDTIIYPQSVNFEPNQALKLGDNILGNPDVVFSEADIDISGWRIISLTAFVDGSSLLVGVQLNITDGVDVQSMTLPSDLETAGLTAVPLTPDDCPNCYLTNCLFYYADGNLLYLEAVWRYIPAPYAFSVHQLANPTQLNITWWQNDAFDVVSVLYQVVDSDEPEVNMDFFFEEAFCQTSNRQVGAEASCVLLDLVASTTYAIMLRAEIKEAPGFPQVTKLGDVKYAATGTGVLVDCSDEDTMYAEINFNAVPLLAELSQKTGDELCFDCDGEINFDSNEAQLIYPGDSYFLMDPPVRQMAGFPKAVVFAQAAAGGPIGGLRVDYEWESVVLVPTGPEMQDLDLALVSEQDGDGRVTFIDLSNLMAYEIGLGFDSSNFVQYMELLLKDASGAESTTGCLGGLPGAAVQCSVVDSFNGYIISSISGSYVSDGSGNRIQKVVPLFSDIQTPDLVLANRDVESCSLAETFNPNDIFSSYWSFSVGLSELECGTEQRVVHQPDFEIQDKRFQVVYEQLITRADDDNSNGDIIVAGQAVISRQSAFQITSMCSFKADSELIAQFETLEEAAYNAAGYASLKFQLQIYRDASFEFAYDSMPVTVALGQNVYYAVELETEQNGLSILARDCWVSTSNNPSDLNNDEDVFRFELETSTCPFEETWERVEAARNAKFDAMTFQSFYMVALPQAEIFIHCRIYACNEEETEGICVPSDTCDEEPAAEQEPEIPPQSNGGISFGRRHRQRRALDELADRGIVKRELISSRQRLFLTNDQAHLTGGSQLGSQPGLVMNMGASVFFFLVVSMFVMMVVAMRRQNSMRIALMGQQLSTDPEQEI